MSVELLGVISDACTWGAMVLLAITVAIQEVRIGKCETACRAMAVRLSRHINE